MRKFECNSCEADCELTMQMDELTPSYCLYDKEKSNWHEVVDSAETEQFGNSEQLPSNPRNLPDWVKVDAIGYDTKTNDYFEIVNINSIFVNVNLFNGGYLHHGYGIIRKHCVEARKRPFNADEMKALVGKIIQKDNDIGVVMHYFGKDNEVLFCNSFATSEDLMNNNCVIYSTGKPCFKLEHLNENGEWVE